MNQESRISRATEGMPRLLFFDPIRVALTTLVIFHHASITYGGSGSWYYTEPGAPEWTVRLLSVFTCINQSFFMGFFFLIAGYLMPTSIARKGTLAYLGDRTIRLWVPLVIFGFLLNPLAKALAIGASGGDCFDSYLIMIGNNSFGQGPLWFNQALLVGALIWSYASYRSWPQLDVSWKPSLHASILLAVLGCGLLAFCLRLVVPTGQNVFGIQIAYCASYLILFFGGARAAPHRWLERITWRHAAPWLIVSVVTMPTLWIAAIVRGLLGSTLWRGGWNSAALHYALWEPLVAAGIIMTSLALARRWYTRDQSWVKQLARASYAAFVVHAPVTVACSWLIKDWASSFLVRFLLAGVLSCMLSFGFGIILTRSLARKPMPPTQPAPA